MSRSKRGPQISRQFVHRGAESGRVAPEPVAIVHYVWLGQNLIHMFGSGQAEEDEMVRLLRTLRANESVSAITVFGAVDESFWSGRVDRVQSVV